MNRFASASTFIVVPGCGTQLRNASSPSSSVQPVSIENGTRRAEEWGDPAIPVTGQQALAAELAAGADTRQVLEGRCRTVEHR
jgi:hypothetical protein